MALSDEQIDKLMDVRKPYSSAKEIERAVTREVRKGDEALIRRMLEKLELFDDAGPPGEGWQSNELEELLADARARLERAP